MSTSMLVIPDPKNPRVVLAPPLQAHKEYYLGTSREFDFAIKDLQIQANRFKEVEKILAALPQSWKRPDPGKYDHDYSFCGSSPNGAITRVVVRELLPEGVIFQGTDSDWREYRRASGNYNLNEFVPPTLSILSFCEVLRRPCPQCYAPQPLIRHHVQTYDSPDGDEWLRRYLVFCCNQVFILDSKESSDRIFD